MQVINWGLMKHPINWAIIILMVLIGGAAWHFISAHAKLSAEKPS